MPEPPPVLEFRGRSVENGVEHFSLYNLETKKAFWTSRSGNGELRVQDFNPEDGLVLIDRTGKTVRLALKMAAPIRADALSGHNTALASASIPVAAPASAAPVSAPEAQRLEQVAEQIRVRRAERQRQAVAKI